MLCTFFFIVYLFDLYRHIIYTLEYKVANYACYCYCYAGDLIQRWTNDYWHSPLHRVVTASATTSTANNSTTTVSEDSTLTNHTAADNTATTDIPVEVAPSSVLSRQAIVFFTGPLEDCVINSLDPALMRNVSWNSAMKKYPPIRSGDHLLQKINKTNLSDVK